MMYKKIIMSSLLAMTFALAGCTNKSETIKAKDNEWSSTDFPLPQFELVNEITTQPGRRSELIEILKSATIDMPGNYIYDIQAVNEHPDKIIITEIWDNPESHQASLQLPSIQQAMTIGRPLIAGLKNISSEQRTVDVD